MPIRDPINITIDRKTWKKLSKLRIDLESSSIDDVLQRILQIITKFKLGIELKEGEEQK